MSAIGGSACRRVPLFDGEDVVRHYAGYKLKRFIAGALQGVWTRTLSAIEYFLKLISGYYR